MIDSELNERFLLKPLEGGIFLFWKSNGQAPKETLSISNNRLKLLKIDRFIFNINLNYNHIIKLKNSVYFHLGCKMAHKSSYLSSTPYQREFLYFLATFFNEYQTE